MTNAIEIDDVRKTYGSVHAVDGITAAVPQGTIYGFLGPNGAGKTTTLRMIMNIIYPDSGRIAILGRPAGEAVKTRIGYLPEERGLYRKMTVRGILEFFGGIMEMRGASLKSSINQWLEKVGLAEWSERKVEELSKGMQQKLQFLVTVLHDPDLLIMDEPFSGLDPVNLDVVKAILVRMRSEGKTVIFSTHMTEQAERLCDSILLIDKGRKVLDSPLEAVMEQYRTNVVAARIEGDASFLSALDFVQEVRPVDRRVEITLADGTSSQELLRAMVDRVVVRSFEEKAPTLHEIFVKLVGGGHE